ncbi:hypothetical protein [Cohnella phaseoli]|uniref:hypothetical protein n=1 Tax=Cohnella phaseoli TaxID=456490 RepID=UPI000E2677AF|nr:hypothetical protein [Cohnella phaseoli]
MEGISQYTNVLAKQLRDHHRANLIHSAIAMKRAGVYAGSFHCSTDVVGGWWSVRINDGLITIQASDDGNNASQKIGGVVRNEVNGGDVTVYGELRAEVPAGAADLAAVGAAPEAEACADRSSVHSWAQTKRRIHSRCAAGGMRLLNQIACQCKSPDQFVAK